MRINLSLLITVVALQTFALITLVTLLLALFSHWLSVADFSSAKYLVVIKNELNFYEQVKVMEGKEVLS